MVRSSSLKIIFAIAIVLFAADSIAAPVSWLCREAGTVWSGDAILSCGVGTGVDEAEARRSALAHAYEELETVCMNSGKCKLEDLEVFPIRTDCFSSTTSGVTCYRGVRANARVMPTSTKSKHYRGSQSGASYEKTRGIRDQIKSLNQLHQMTESMAEMMEESF